MTFWHLLLQFPKFNNVGLLTFSDFVTPPPLLENLTTCITIVTTHALTFIKASFCILSWKFLLPIPSHYLLTLFFPFIADIGDHLLSTISSKVIIDDNVDTFWVIFKNSKRVVMYYLFIQRQSLSRKHISAKLQKCSVL